MSDKNRDTTDDKKEDLYTVLGVNVRKLEPNTTVVVLPNGSNIPLENVDMEEDAKTILHHLQAVSSDASLNVAQVDKDETHAEKKVRVITLKTNAQRKGNV